MTLDREKYFFTPRYTRGEVSKVFGITKDTLRHYEKCGLITPYENEKNKYKYYSIVDLELLNVILFLRAMDVSIEEIPKFVKCKDVETYGSFLENQISKANRQISYWTNIKSILTYLKDTLGEYGKIEHNTKIVENTTFIFRKAKFDYKNYDIRKMAPKKVSSAAFSNVIRLKIVGKEWVYSNREDTSDMKLGYLCREDEEDINRCVLHKAVMITTLEPLEKITNIITEFWEKYKEQYEFDDKTYIIEHKLFNIFNQDALLRNIYLPIKNEK